MKLLIVAAAALLALGASAGAAELAITTGVQFEVQRVDGLEVQVTPFEVTIGGNARATALAVTYYATSLRANFLSAYTFCTSRKWSLASPKSEEEQRALAAIMSDNQFGNTWLGGVCANERWTWLSDNTKVSYNNWYTSDGLIGPTPSCGTTSDAVFIYGASNGIIAHIHKWCSAENFEIMSVICQA